MTFLDEVVLGSTIRSWLITLGVGVVGALVLTFVRRQAVKRLKKLAMATASDLDDLIVDLIGRTRSPFFFALSFYLGSRALDVNPGAETVISAILKLMVFIQVGIWGNGIIAYFINRASKPGAGGEGTSRATLSAVGFAGRAILWGVMLLLVLDNLGFDITALVAGLGVGGVAVALAVQNILGDLFSSLSILLDKPFVVGDFIVVDAVSGTVEYTGLKTTRVRSLSGEQVILSNTDLLKSRIRNYKRMQERRIVFSLGVTYQTSHEKLERIPAMIREIIQAQPGVRFDRAHFHSFGDSALLFEVVYVVLNPDYMTYMDIQQAINLGIARTFTHEGIEFAYPTRTLYVQNQGGTGVSAD